jgi:succinate dehydrogenase/fumarate reductase flavoprotein subunit
MSGIAMCKRGTTAAVKVAADAAWLAYLAGLPIGGDMPGHLVRLEMLEDSLIDAGAYTVSGLALSGGLSTTSNGDIVIGENSLATLADDPNGRPSLALTWQEVA